VVDLIQKKWASVYANEKFICLRTLSGMRMAASDPKGKVILLPVNASSEEIGSALFESLFASRMLDISELKDFFDIASVSARYEEWVVLLMNKYNYESRQVLFKQMKHCQVQWKEGAILIIPTYHEKLEAWSGKGFNESSYVTVSENATSDELGSGVLLALSRCTGK